MNWWGIGGAIVALIGCYIAVQTGDWVNDMDVRIALCIPMWAAIGGLIGGTLFGHLWRKVYR